MSVKTKFSIKDLENLSGIKAHTIRIWEKRYDLLEPDRTETNIRLYDMENLRKLLNVTFLYNKGYKISKIARLKKDETHSLIREKGLQDESENYALKEFKMAMLDFDQDLFNRVYRELSRQKSFPDIFFTVFVPFLNEIGLLWQTDTIDPSHERFISELIRQKVIQNIEAAYLQKVHKHEKLFVLYLPYDEIHEIGLLYLNYAILSAGYKTVYLGNNIPIDSLTHLLDRHERIVFVSYFTVRPDKSELKSYLEAFYNTVCKGSAHELWLLGKQLDGENASDFPAGIRLFNAIPQLTAEL